MKIKHHVVKSLLLVLFSILPVNEANSDVLCDTIQKTCSEEVGRTICDVTQITTPHVTITECSDDSVSYNVNESVWNELSYRTFRLQLVCINQSSSEIVAEDPIKFFHQDQTGDSDYRGELNICDFYYLEEPEIECGLQLCGFIAKHCVFRMTTSTKISCFEPAISHHNSSSMSSNSVSNSSSSTSSLFVSNSSSSWPIASSLLAHSNSYTNPSISNTASDFNPSSNMLSSILDTFPSSSSSNSLYRHLESSSTVNSSATPSDSVLTVILVVVLPILFIGVVCAFVMLGSVFYAGNLSKADNVELKFNQKENSNACSDAIVDLNLPDVHSIHHASATTIFEELCTLQDKDFDANTSTKTPSFKSSAGHLPTQLHKSSTHNQNLIAASASTEISQNTSMNTATHPSTELGDDNTSIITQEFGECASVTLEEVNCEWDKMRPRSTDLTTNHKQCSDGYRVGSSYISLGDLHYSKSNYSDTYITISH